MQFWQSWPWYLHTPESTSCSLYSAPSAQPPLATGSSTSPLACVIQCYHRPLHIPPWLCPGQTQQLCLGFSIVLSEGTQARPLASCPLTMSPKQMKWASIIFHLRSPDSVLGICLSPPTPSSSALPFSQPGSWPQLTSCPCQILSCCSWKKRRAWVPASYMTPMAPFPPLSSDFPSCSVQGTCDMLSVSPWLQCHFFALLCSITGRNTDTCPGDSRPPIHAVSQNCLSGMLGHHKIQSHTPSS